MTVRNASPKAVLLSLILVTLLAAAVIVLATFVLTGGLPRAEIRSFTQVTDEVLSGTLPCGRIENMNQARADVAPVSKRTTIIMQQAPSHNVVILCEFLVGLESPDSEMATIVYFSNGEKVKEKITMDTKMVSFLWDRSKPPIQ